MLGQTQNQLLQQIEQGIKDKVPPKLAGAFLRVIAAGEKVMYSPQSHQLMQEQLHMPGDPVMNIGDGVAKLLGFLMEHGKNSIPPAVLPLAGSVLVCEAMDFAEKAGIVQVNNETVAAATKEMVTKLLALSGITPDKIHAMMQQAAQKQGMNQQLAPSGIINSAQGA